MPAMHNVFSDGSFYETYSRNDASNIIYKSSCWSSHVNVSSSDHDDRIHKQVVALFMFENNMKIDMPLFLIVTVVLLFMSIIKLD